MEDDGIKSAFELAMERIAALPRLTAEEIAEQKEKENAPVGAALAVKYLQGAISEDDLPAELNRFDEERRRIIRRAFLTALVQELRLDNEPEKVKLALAGVAAVRPDNVGRCEQAARDFSQILHEFEAEKEGRRNEFLSAAIRRMKELGISGSAVRPNLKENEDWQKAMQELAGAYEPRLQQIRSMLLEAEPPGGSRAS